MRINLMKAVVLSAVLFGLTGAVSGGITLRGLAPQITIDPNNFFDGTLPLEQIDSIAAAVNDQLSRSFSSVLGTLSASLDNFGTLDNLARGFSGANSYTLQSSSFPGVRDYDRFSISSGANCGLQLPSLESSDYQNLGDKMRDNPNILMGVGVGAGYLTAGYHFKQLLPGLYGEIAGGYIKATVGKETPVHFENGSLSLNVSYTFFRSTPFLKYCQWQGATVSLGAGWQKSSMRFSPDLQPISTTVSLDNTGDPLIDQVFSGGPLILQVFPTVTFALSSQTVSIPLMVHTSARAFTYGEIDAGAGIYINTGTSEVRLDGSNRLSLSNLPIGMSSDQGTITLHNANAHIAPDLISFRMYVAPGAQYKHLRVAVPLMFYAPSGLSYGITAGIEY